ncbi:HIT-like protein [Jaminaea rosea]|uniref:HIT-like protein n=1 Tax=Jaminaea rosea TaxID=1569628 RepID=A0A316UJG1_9BASI|nr:HIT-like protein [Jaminaea rosea]PWN25360.1 HIT-like protein [Jaminaea rosea]
MTTFTLSSFRDRPLQGRDDCTFCQIASGSQPAHLVYESERCLAFLDILPIRRGHVLVVPRRHVDNLAALSVVESNGSKTGEAGEAEEFIRGLVVVTRGVGKALEDDRLQIITNQVYGQVVPHLHFHIVPAPPLPGSTPSLSSSTASSRTSPKKETPPPQRSLLPLIGHGRDELDDDEAVELARQIRAAVDEVVKEETARRTGGPDAKL